MNRDLLEAPAPPAWGETPRVLPGVGMGQAAVGRAGEILTAVLGSCVGVILHHPRLRTAALAHVVLPERAGRPGEAARFADSVIPHLLELLARAGTPPAGLTAKLAGGANMFGTAQGPLQIGEANAAAVLKALETARIPVLARSLGGRYGRRIRFDCRTGELRVEAPGQPTELL